MTAGASEGASGPGAARHDPPVRIGISACLLGQEVRYDGGHKRDAFLNDTLAGFVEWVPVCPEVECGFGTPREAMRLVRADGSIRLRTVKTSVDLTGRLERFSKARVEALTSEDLSGYVLKKDSPSCGFERVKIHGLKGQVERAGRGLFAAALVERFPHLPIEEEGRLSDPRLRENFIERVFAYRRLTVLFSGRWTAGAVVEFHTRHKLILMAHSPDAYRGLGQLAAHLAGTPRKAFAHHYADGFMTALATMATPRRHVNVLQHIAGYFKASLDRDSRHELAASIEDYRRGLVPLIVPVTLIRHHVRHLGIAYLANQLYLEPHPKELMLRNHV